ncbi:hypothetical protein AB205_0190390 [Aquarana catesbeiana]|uniref:Uncharacterized protein n=1 Tax=Aquarana catesbeiana TaxID=8400 RepID=A0A2G9R4A6_AQUCT|nr:hypothetical protein AB205_0190390 [Aquarana catesbeiana]
MTPSPQIGLQIAVQTKFGQESDRMGVNTQCDPIPVRGGKKGSLQHFRANAITNWLNSHRM